MNEDACLINCLALKRVKEAHPSEIVQTTLDLLKQPLLLLLRQQALQEAEQPLLQPAHPLRHAIFDKNQTSSNNLEACD